MKLSTTMLVITVLLFFGVLTAYNLSLKAAYLKGTFRDRFGEHTFMRLDNVKEVQLKSANLMSMGIEYGEREGVWISNRVKDRIKVHRTGEMVMFSAANADIKNYINIGSDDVVLIVSNLTKFSTYNYQGKGQKLQNYNGEVYIKGLTGDAFTMILAEQSTVYMEGNKFKWFNAVVGGDKYWSRLAVHGDNRLDTAYFDIRSKSSLELQNPEIAVSHYKIGDSSRVELWGRSARSIIH